MRLYIRDLALRSRVESLGVDADVVVDLADRRCVEKYAAERPPGRAVGFYPHVQGDLADRARELGIEPVEKRVFFR